MEQEKLSFMNEQHETIADRSDVHSQGFGMKHFIFGF